MNPKHLDNVPDNCRAVAPYNFVELPDQVVEAKLPLPEGDRYYLDHHTGRIVCTLTTDSLLYTRCGWSPEDFAEHGEKSFQELPDELKQKRANFFINPATKQQIVPGSSLRGMLRTLVEIVSFGKIDRVSDAQKLFFRAVAAEADDPLKEAYKKYVKPKNIKAGYLVKRQDNWFIRPAMPIDREPFVWVKEDKLCSISDYIPMSNLSEYRPRYFVNISFQDIYTKNTRRFAGKVSGNCTEYQYQGVVVASGNMLEGGTNSVDLKRKNHCIIREPNSKAEPIPISEDAIRDYCSALTPFQKQEPPFDQHSGVLKNGRCIFYCQPQTGQPVTLFGQSPNFRIPYSHQNDGKASTARDFIPDFLKDSKAQPVITDVAEAIFGFVRRDKQPEGIEQSRAGRVFVSDGILNQNQEEQVRTSQEQDAKPILLSSPKPTTFQHYLVQNSANKIELKHYASNPPTKTEERETPGETVIRGHKLYWHKPAKIEVPSDASDTQTSLIKPIDSGIKFTFTIHFENLPDVELGALLWVLSLTSNKSQTLKTGKHDEKYCFSFGMGKPLGMGAVKIDYELHISDRTSRYSKLFDVDDKQWDIAEPLANLEQERDYVKEFEKFILHEKTGISENDHPKESKATCLREVPRIEMLLAMLQCDEIIDEEQTQYKYMELEAFKNRKVLPTPLQIANIEDKRRLNNPASTVVKKTDNVVKSERQEAVQKQKFALEQVLEATVIRIKGNNVTYQMLEGLKLTEREPKKAVLLREGQAVQVKITALKEDGSIKSVKFIN